MKKLSQMNANELRDYAEFLGADKKRLYGTGNDVLRIMIRSLEQEIDDGRVYLVVIDGVVLYRGSGVRCGYMVSKDKSGLLEIYPEKARI
jgi:hypothetical protein